MFNNWDWSLLFVKKWGGKAGLSGSSDFLNIKIYRYTAYQVQIVPSNGHFTNLQQSHFDPSFTCVEGERGRSST